MAQIPYELLVRLNYETGALQGAHVKFYDSVTQQEGDAQPVAMAGATGFPLATILSAIQSGSIISADAANAKCVAHEATIATLNAEIAALKAV